jgi:hypothetical protein
MTARTFSVLFAFVFVASGTAWGTDLTVDINGTQLSTTGNSIDITGTYGNVIVERNDQSEPPVVTMDDTAEVLELRNARIRVASGSQNEYTLAFWATFTNPPSTDPNGMTYKLRTALQGMVKRLATGASGDLVRAKGAVTCNGVLVYAASSQDNPWLSKTITTANWTFFDGEASKGFTLADFGSQHCSGNRSLQVEFKFTLLNANDRLTLPKLQGLRLEGSAGLAVPEPAPVRPGTR